MPFGSLSPEERIRILLELVGGPQYVAQMEASGAATAGFGKSQSAARREVKLTNTQLFLQRQEMYTLRRFTFMLTTSVVALAGYVGYLGLKFYNTSQTATVGFTKMLHSMRKAKQEVHDLYVIAAKTPFTFPAIVQAARYLQPYTNNLKLTNQIINDLTNSLSAMGNISDASLNRGSLQLAHMFTLGRLTGQILYAMARDNVPMQRALEKEFHASGLTIKRDIAGGLITATMAAKALHDYVQSTPGLRTAALVQSTKTLSGAFSTLKDLLGMGMGKAESGLFNSFTKTIAGVDKALLPIISGNKPITLINLMDAFDKIVSPRTHLVIDIFITLRTVLRTVAFEFGFIVKAIDLILGPIGQLSSLFGANRFASKLLGIALGTLITLWTLAKIQAIAFAIAEHFANSATLTGTILSYAQVTALYVWTIAQGILTGEITFSTIAMGIWNGALRLTGISILFMQGQLYMLVASFQLATAGAWAFTAALLANPITWIVAAVLLLTVGLVVLYFRWKAFHNLVDNTFNFITHNKYGIAAAMGTAFGPLIAAAAALRYIIDNMHRIQHTVHKTLLNSPTGDLGFGTGSTKPTRHRSAWHNFLHSLITPVPGAATGGMLTSGGIIRVGEKGPEILHLPQGASIQPLNNNHLEGQFHITVTPQDIYMDGTKVGSVVSTAVLDKIARQ